MIVFFIYEEVLPLCTPKWSYMQDLEVFEHVEHTSFDFQENTFTCLESPLDDSVIFKDWSSQNY